MKSLTRGLRLFGVVGVFATTRPDAGGLHAARMSAKAAPSKDRLRRAVSSLTLPVWQRLGGLACALFTAGLTAEAQVVEPVLIRPGSLVPWALAADVGVPVPALADLYFGGDGVDRTIAGPNVIDTFAAYLRGSVVSGRAVADPAKAYSVGSDRTMSISFIAGTGMGRLYLNTYAKGQLTATLQGTADISARVQVQDMTAGGGPVMLQGIPGAAPNTFTLSQAPPAPPPGPPPPTAINKFNVGWLNQFVDLVPNHRYQISGRLTANAGPIPKNTIGEDLTDISQVNQDQYFNIAFSVVPPIPAGRTMRNPQWRTGSGIRSTTAQGANAVRNGVTLNGQGVNIGMIEGDSPITTHVDLPTQPAAARRLRLINDGVQFVGADGPSLRDEHATAVAGIIAAGAGHGVAPAANLYDAALSAGTAAGVANFQNAVNQLAGVGVTVINNSFSFPNLPRGAQNQNDQFINRISATRNIVFVAAAGNGGRDPNDNSAASPGSASATIDVGALDYTLSKVANFSSSFKNGGEPPNLCAPGALIDTTVVVPMRVSQSLLDPVNPPSAYDYTAYGYYQATRGSSFSGPINGTSFAAPMVAGAVGLYQQLANLPDFAALRPGILGPKAIRTALMTTAWKTKADGTRLYRKDGVTPFDPVGAVFAPGGPVDEDRTVWADMGAGWLDVMDFLRQLNARVPVKARAALGGGGDFAAGGAPSDVPGPGALAAMSLTGPRTLDSFQIYPSQQQEYTLPVALQVGDSLAVTVAWDENTNADQNLDLAIAVYQSQSGSTNGNPNLISGYIFAANGEVVLPPSLGPDPLIVYANGGWSTTEHLYFQINSASKAGQYYIRVINLSPNMDTFALAAWLKSPTSYPDDSVVNPQNSVTAIADAGGSVTPAGVFSVDPGTNIQFTANPSPGFQVDQWYLNDVSVTTNATSLSLNNVQTDQVVRVTFLIANSALDLSVNTATAGASVAVGSNVVFCLPVQNNGSADASNVIVTDLLPPGTTFVSAQASQGTCSFDSGSQTVTCQLGGLAAANSAQVTLTVTAPNSPGTITNYVSVTNDVFDAVPANNSATSTVTVVETLTVSASSDTHGAIYPSGVFAVLEGQAQSFIAVPNSNYVVQSWLVNGVTEQEGGTNFVLSDIETNEVVSVVFAAAAVALPNDFPTPVDKGSWIDSDGGAHPWKVGLATWNGAPIWDDQFATQVTALAKNGVLMHFAFAECFGGGMLQNLSAIPAAALQLSGTSGAKWNQASWYREPPYALLVPLPNPNNHDADWGDTYIDGAAGNNNALNAAIDAWNDDPFRLDTPARPNASGPDESFPFFETAQYRENPAGSGAAFTHNPAKGNKYAILYSGRPGGNSPENPGEAGAEARPADPNVDAEQINDLWNLLTDPLGYNYAPANIQVLFGNGARPVGAPNNMRGRVVPATMQNLWTAFNNLAALTNADQLFFFANDHGVARNDAMPANAYLLVPRSPNHNPNFNTNIWLPASPLPSEGAPQGLERYSTNSSDPFLGWATDPGYVVSATITQTLQTLTVEVGDTAVFTVGADGTPPLTYQWQLDGVNLPGATNSSLRVSNADLASYGTYAVLVNNSYGAQTSSIAMLFVEGLPPVAGNVWLQAVQNQSASITTTQILAYAYDPDGDPLTVSSVQAASTNGGSVAFAGNTVTYTPATNYFGFDSFSYTVSDGNGGTATGNVSVLVLFSSNISSTLMSPKRLPGGKLQLTFVGAPGCPYGVQRATVLTGPWSELGVVTVGSGGSGQLVDTNPPPTGAFYRTVFPP